MTLNQIITFAAIAKHLNLSRASAACHVSQSSLTQQIRKLELEYKTKLYKKSNRGIVLTDRGELFLRHVKNILAEVQKLNDEFSVFSFRTTENTGGWWQFYHVIISSGGACCISKNSSTGTAHAQD